MDNSYRYTKNQLVGNVQFETAYEVAIGLLTPREHSKLELRRKLVKRRVDHSTIDAVVDRLCEQDYLSDDRFTRLYIEERIQRGDGPLKITGNLAKRGIERCVINEFLPSDEDFWRDRARTVIAKRFSRALTPEIAQLPRNEWNRLCTFLQNRGFRASTVMQVLNFETKTKFWSDREET